MAAAELDTLFVDEGFGSLDADTLEDAVRTTRPPKGTGPVVVILSGGPGFKVAYMRPVADAFPTVTLVRQLDDVIERLDGLVRGGADVSVRRAGGRHDRRGRSA